MTASLCQPPLPQDYLQTSEAELSLRIARRKAELADRLLILGHHYQQDAILAFADFVGDSLKLSQIAAQYVQERNIPYVIFCGVHFMAETADILTPPQTTVILPNLAAGCSLANMAEYSDLLQAWHNLHQALAPEIQTGRLRLIPITYINSTANLKAFCGQHGGAVCTSSNALQVLRWALAGGTQPRRPTEQIKVLFLPDQHLGRNTGVALGLDPQNDMCLWDPHAPDELGGCNLQQLRRASLILWNGLCSVHMAFRPEHILRLRQIQPHITIMVHPECTHDVVRLADRVGSTEAIVKAVDQAPPGSSWAIGTEATLVHRLARRAAERNVHVRFLADRPRFCPTMYRIDLAHLAWTLDNLSQGQPVNRIQVPSPIRDQALLALQRMLQISH